MDLRSKLNTAKNIASDTPISERMVNRQSVSMFTGSVDDLTEKVFGSQLIDDGTGKKPYDANEEMKMLKEGLPKDKLINSKLPSAIKESMASNPLIMTQVDPKLDAFTAKLAATQGIKKTANIMEQLDEMDKEKARKEAINESLQRAGAEVDYNLIKSIVENAVKSLKNELRNELNESISRNNAINNDNSLKVMKMSDKFLFLDSDNNIFECQMVYKGKNKPKKS